MKSFNDFLEEGATIHQNFVIATQVTDGMWKLNDQEDDLKLAKQRMKDIFAKTPKAVIDGKLAKKKKWKLYQIVNWDGKGKKA